MGAATGSAGSVRVTPQGGNGAIDAILASERSRILRGSVLLALLVAAVLGSWWASGLFDVGRVAEGAGAIATLLAESWPPDFSRWRAWIGPLLDTVAMSAAGTALAVLLSVPVAALAARNMSPGPRAYAFGRLLLNLLRAVPELILGIVFVAAVGFGVLPGVLALALHSIGMVGKFFAEAIEHAHPAPLEAAQAAGASRFQTWTHGVLPQVLPQFADIAIYRWEYNFRASTVMGMVGAGGIGTELIGSLRLMDYTQVSALLLVILAAVTLVDQLSAVLRRLFK